MVLGNIGNVLIIILFKKHRHNPCGIYILTAAFVNDLYVILVGFFFKYFLFIMLMHQHVHLFCVNFVILYQI